MDSYLGLRRMSEFASVEERCMLLFHCDEGGCIFAYDLRLCDSSILDRVGVQKDAAYFHNVCL